MASSDASPHDAARLHAAVLSRDTRGLIRITGADRAKWLNNLVTNVIATLQPGEGNYAFAVNVKGRVQFDLNMLVRPDCILLDIDRRWIEGAAKFLNRYIITEDVALAEITSETRRVAVIGPKAHAMVANLGFGNLTPMPWFQSTEGEIAGAPTLMFRHDFAGLPGAEFITFGEHAPTAVDQIERSALSQGARSIDPATVDALRIEAGIPASVDDIDEEVIPPETGQIERGISYHKGCYLGQEVIERMRAHKVLARKLVGIRFDGDSVVPGRAALWREDVEVGRAMSGCLSPALSGAPLSLAYIKTAHAIAGTRVVARTPAGDRSGEVITLPVRQA